jgi:F5/8 type C domain.
MAYEKQTWTDDVSPISKTRMDHIEDGIKDLDDYIIAIDPVITSLAVDLAKTNFKIDAHTGASKNELTQMAIDVLTDPDALDTTNSTENITSCFDPVLKALRTGTINLTAAGITALSGGNYSGKTAADAFGASSLWQSSQTGAEVSGVAWIGCDFGAPRKINQISLYQDLYEYAITSVKFQKSDDGSTWADVETFSSLTYYGSPDNPNIRTVASPVEARYFRLMANNDTPSGPWAARVEFRHITPTTANAIWQSDTASSVPVSAWITADKEATGALTFYISRDGGTTFTECTLDDLTDISAQPNGSSVVVKVAFDGTSEIAQLNGIAWGWR